ncbi:hypothetical protein FRC12_002794 [Ceratobasidium sp. 428]|nr:hypothetical protein FRC12_002794 [Ceratobasidium sp. 428]
MSTEVYRRPAKGAALDVAETEVEDELVEDHIHESDEYNGTTQDDDDEGYEGFDVPLEDGNVEDEDEDEDEQDEGELGEEDEADEDEVSIDINDMDLEDDLYGF